MVSIRLMPRDERFFDLFVADGENLYDAAQELHGAHADVRPARRAHRCASRRSSTPGDEIGDEVAERLDRAFITPLDREDIHELARRMDDVLDRIQETAETLLHLRHHGPDRGGPATGRHPGRAGRGAADGARQARGHEGPRWPPQARPRARERGRRPLASRHRPALPRAAGRARGHQVARHLPVPGGVHRRGRGRRGDHRSGWSTRVPRPAQPAGWASAGVRTAQPGCAGSRRT